MPSRIEKSSYTLECSPGSNACMNTVNEVGQELGSRRLQINRANQQSKRFCVAQSQLPEKSQSRCTQKIPCQRYNELAGYIICSSDPVRTINMTGAALLAAPGLWPATNGPWR